MMVHEIILSQNRKTLDFKIGLSDKVAYSCNIGDITLISPDSILDKIESCYLDYNEGKKFKKFSQKKYFFQEFS